MGCAEPGDHFGICEPLLQTVPKLKIKADVHGRTATRSHAYVFVLSYYPGPYKYIWSGFQPEVNLMSMD